jgi:hypothetical protein
MGVSIFHKIIRELLIVVGLLLAIMLTAAWFL